MKTNNKELICVTRTVCKPNRIHQMYRRFDTLKREHIHL